MRDDITYSYDDPGPTPIADTLRPFLASLPSAELLDAARATLSTFAPADVHPRSLHAICAELVARYSRVLALVADLHGESQ